MIFINGTNVDAPKNRGDFNDCLPYENFYIKPVFKFKQSITGLIITIF